MAIVAFEEALQHLKVNQQGEKEIPVRLFVASFFFLKLFQRFDHSVHFKFVSPSAAQFIFKGKYEVQH